MALDRRTLLCRAGGAIVLSSASSSSLFAAAPSRAVLLVPLAGSQAGLGTSMRRGALLAQSDARLLEVVGDTAGAARAVRRGARMVLGPVFAAEVRPVLAAVGGRAPVVSFSNDEGLRDSGAFLLGLGAGQLAGAVLRYARGRGVRSVAIAGAAGAWHDQARAGAARVAGELGLSIVAEGVAADAVLATDIAAPAIATARAADTQLLLCVAAVDARPEALAATAGAWSAAPDPDAFAGFADRYRAINGGEPGLLAALAHDAALVAIKAGGGRRAALLDPAGFTGATGAFRFRDDGTAERTLAILAAGADGHRVIGQARGG